MIGCCLDPLRCSVIGGMLVGIVLGAASALAGASLTAEGAWVPWAPPVLKVHVAYMTIVNRGMTDKHIVGADSPDYERIELHRSAVKDGVSTMQAVENVTVPANGRVEFAPTGLHLMLIGPRRPQAVDDHVRIALRLSDGEELDVSAVVRRRDDAGHGAHSHQ
jgi:periplasmic copper chaperone A